MERPHPRFTVTDTLRALGILVVVYFVLGALMAWAVEPRYPTVFRWSARAVTFVFLLFVLMGLMELFQALWWRSGSRDRRKKNP